MVTIVQPKYLIETTPILVSKQEDGSTKTNMGSLSLRVVDSYTKMPVGAVIHCSTDNSIGYKAVFFFDETGNFDVEAPADGWGTRFDLAAYAVWCIFSKRLPLHERLKRWCWRWIGIGCFLFGTVWGVLTTIIVEVIAQNKRVDYTELTGSRDTTHTASICQILDCRKSTCINSPSSDSYVT